jgi:hypothetical protein
VRLRRSVHTVRDNEWDGLVCCREMAATRRFLKGTMRLSKTVQTYVQPTTALLHPYTTSLVPQAQALRPAISMYEAATEHTKALVLTAPVQRLQRTAELNREKLRGRVDRHAVPYQIVGCSKRHASIPIGQTERIYAPTLRVYLANSMDAQVPNRFSHTSLHSSSGGTWSRKEKSAVLYQELAPTSLSLANYCVCIVIMETGSAAPCHDTFQSVRGCELQDKCSRCEECVSLAPAFASLPRWLRFT